MSTCMMKLPPVVSGVESQAARDGVLVKEKEATREPFSTAARSVPSPVSRDVVCISYATGSGGEDVGRLVADRLGFLYVNEEIVARAAERGGIDPEKVADEERRKPLFAGLLDYLMEESGGEAGRAVVRPAVAEEVSAAVRRFIRDAIQEVAAGGKAVIVAHAASYAIGTGGKALRVLITAPRETRAKRLGAAEGLADLEASKAVKKSDAGRADYLKRFYGVGEELPIHYDLVINTEALSVNQAAAVIAQATTDEPSSEKAVGG